MIVKFRMLLEDHVLMKKYEQALGRVGIKDAINYHSPYLVEVEESTLKLSPCKSYACGIKTVVWHCREGVFELIQNEPFPTEIEVVGEIRYLHLLICALISKDVDYDHFVKGLMLDYKRIKPPAKFILNYLTGGYVFRDNAENSCDVNLTLGEFLAMWLNELDLDCSYQNIELEPEPRSIAGKLKAYRS